MHPNDILYVLTFALLNPLAAAAPIFPNSNDISEDGYFLPEARTGGSGSSESFNNRRDLQDQLDQSIREGNQDPGYNVPDIPNLPKRDLIGTLEGFVNNGVNTVEKAANGLLGGILKERDGQDLHLTLEDIRRLQAAEGQSKRSLDQRDLIGTLEGFVNNGVNTVEKAANGLLGGILRRDDSDLHLTLDQIRQMQAAGAQSKRDLKSDINSAIDDANEAIENVAGDVDGQLNPPDIPHIPKERRDLKSDINSAIDDANQAIENVAGDVSGDLNPPDIPHISKERRDLKSDINSAIDDANQAIDNVAGDVSGDLNPPDIPHLPARGLDQRDLIGTIEGVVNNGIGTVEQAVHGILGGILKEKRDVVGDINSAIQTANNDIESIANDAGFSQAVPDIPNIPSSKRDVVGDINSAIDKANQDIESIAKDAGVSQEVPDIPNLPTKRGELPGAFEMCAKAPGVCGGPANIGQDPKWFEGPEGLDLGPGPVVSGTILPKK